ncbi:MAG TPA: Uma2 family endonuclease, partial [Allocoleopsis sp.]
AEYWVIDVQAKRIFAFQLQENGQYDSIEISQVLTGLPISLLVAALHRLENQSNGMVANWFWQEIKTLNS